MAWNNDNNKDFAKECRITFATNKDTFNIINNLALETMRTVSQTVDALVVDAMYRNPDILHSTSRNFSLQILTKKSEELLKNIEKMDEFYEFKRNLWEICLILSGKNGKISVHGLGESAFDDLCNLIGRIKGTEPILFNECLLILKKTLKQKQLEVVYSTL